MQHHEFLEVVYECLRDMKGQRGLQFTTLVLNVWRKIEGMGLSDAPGFRHQEVETRTRRVFWDLFKRGVITLGNSVGGGHEFPWFEVTEEGGSILEGREFYMQELESYVLKVKGESPDIDNLSELYLRESMRSFESECYLASAVMLGVACENEFLKLIELALASSHSSKFMKTEKEKWITSKITEFNKALTSLSVEMRSYDPDLLVDLSVQLSAILTLIKNYRNDAGHPTGKRYGRDDIFPLLIVVIPCLKKIHELKLFFSASV